MARLLALFGLGQHIYSRWLFQRLLSGILAVVVLAVIISILIAALLVGGFTAAYFAFLQHGTDPQIALAVIGVSAIMVIAMLVFLMHISLHHLRQTPRILLRRSPLSSRAMDALYAFTDGLMADR